MKHQITFRAIALMFVLLLTVGIVAADSKLSVGEKASPVRASRCHLLSGGGETQFDLGEGYFLGVANVTLDDEEYAILVKTHLIGLLQEDEDGTIHGVTSHEFHFPDGSAVITFDDVIMKPTAEEGVYDFVSKAVIESGWGSFRRLNGRLVISGQLTNMLMADWTVSGKMCYY